MAQGGLPAGIDTAKLTELLQKTASQLWLILFAKPRDPDFVRLRCADKINSVLSGCMGL
jgi:hypothetical protein